jgi:transposase
MTDQQKKQIIALSDKGWSHDKIGRQVGVDPSTVWKYLKKVKFGPPGPPGPPRKAPLTQAQKDQITGLREQHPGMSQTDIAEQLGFSKSSVNRILAEWQKKERRAQRFEEQTPDILDHHNRGWTPEDIAEELKVDVEIVRKAIAAHARPPAGAGPHTFGRGDRRDDGGGGAGGGGAGAGAGSGGGGAGVAGPVWGVQEYGAGSGWQVPGAGRPGGGDKDVVRYPHDDLERAVHKLRGWFSQAQHTVNEIGVIQQDLAVETKGPSADELQHTLDKLAVIHEDLLTEAGLLAPLLRIVNLEMQDLDHHLAQAFM